MGQCGTAAELRRKQLSAVHATEAVGAKMARLLDLPCGQAPHAGARHAVAGWPYALVSRCHSASTAPTYSRSTFRFGRSLKPRKNFVIAAICQNFDIIPTKAAYSSREFHVVGNALPPIWAMWR